MKEDLKEFESIVKEKIPEENDVLECDYYKRYSKTVRLAYNKIRRKIKKNIYEDKIGKKKDFEWEQYRKEKISFYPNSHLPKDPGLMANQGKVKVPLPKDYFLLYEAGDVPGPLIEYAKKKGIKTDLVSVYSDFVLYHTKKGSKMANWLSAWQTWVRNQIKFDPTCLNGPTETTRQSDLESILAN